MNKYTVRDTILEIHVIEKKRNSIRTLHPRLGKSVCSTDSDLLKVIERKSAS